MDNQSQRISTYETPTGVMPSQMSDTVTATAPAGANLFQCTTGAPPLKGPPLLHPLAAVLQLHPPAAVPQLCLLRQVQAHLPPQLHACVRLPPETHSRPEVRAPPGAPWPRGSARPWGAALLGPGSGTVRASPPASHALSADAPAHAPLLQSYFAASDYLAGCTGYSGRPQEQSTTQAGHDVQLGVHRSWERCSASDTWGPVRLTASDGRA